MRAEMKLTGILWYCFLLSLFFSAFAVQGPGLKSCTVDKTGILTAFSGETVTVTLPCKYHLADITCGKYRVKVTPGNGNPTKNMHSSPVSVWVKIVDLGTSNYLKVRTSLNRLKRFIDGRVSSVWDTKEGDLTGLDIIGYQSEPDAMVLQKTGVFDVTFSAAGDVSVTCAAEEFTSRPVPDTLCGNGTDSAEQTSVNYLILDDKTVAQSKTCVYKAHIFQTCDGKREALTQCDVILNDESRVQCLSQSSTSLGIYYRDCLRSVCSDNATLLEPMNTFISENCGPCPVYQVLDDVRRDVNYGTGSLCDRNLAPGWYRFLLNGSDAVMPTACVPLDHCGTAAPVWLDLQGAGLPAEGQETNAIACDSWTSSCCEAPLPITVHNCGDFYVYNLTIPRFCNLAYCAVRP